MNIVEQDVNAEMQWTAIAITYVEYPEGTLLTAQYGIDYESNPG